MRVPVKEIEVLTRELALFFKVSRQTIGVWHQKGLPKTKRGTFPLLACFEWWRENISQESKDSTLTEERRLKTAIERKIKQLELEEKEESLIPRTQSISWLSQIVTECRAALLNLPRRVSELLTGLDSKTIEEVLRFEIYEILWRLSGKEKPEPPLELLPWDKGTFEIIVGEDGKRKKVVKGRSMEKVFRGGGEEVPA